MITAERKAEIARQNGKKQCGKTPPNAKLFPGLLVGHLLLIERVDPVGSKNKNSIKWLCECQCESRTRLIKTSNHLNRMDCKLHCGCVKAPRPPNFKGYKEISGSWFYRVNRNARLRGIEVAISLEDVWDLFIRQNRKCALSGMPLSFEDHTENIASLDRIDSKRGYTVDNIQLLHKDVNRIKLDFDQAYLVQICKQIAEHQTRIS